MRIGPFWMGAEYLCGVARGTFFQGWAESPPNANHPLKESTMATKRNKTRSTKAARTAKPAATPTVDDGRLKSGRLSSKGMTCLCGCGEETATDGARFRTGHDARLKGIFGRILAGNKRDGDVIPPEVRPFLQEDGGIAGYTAQFKGSAVKLAKVA